MTENEVLKDLQNYQGILKAKTRINASVNPEIALNAITEAIEVIQSYRAIGTIDEFKALKEKSVAKKIKYEDYCGFRDAICPVCRHYIDSEDTYCSHCGQKLDWQ